MELSKRLAAVAALVPEKSRLVDIGTDHAYLPIALMKERRLSGALACDLRTGALEKAKENIRKSGLENQIQTRLSDGLKEITENDGDTLVLAGMGGPLMIRILSDEPEKTKHFSVWILQPQSEVSAVRRFVYEAGYHIEAEDFVIEDDKPYPMLRAVWGRKACPKEAALAFGPLLLERRPSELRVFLQRAYAVNEKILDSLSMRDGERIEKRRAELLKESALMREALNYYEL